MTTAIKRRRGTTSQHSTFTGLDGELTVDTTKETLVIHDGATAGGFPLLREDLNNNSNVATLSGTQTFSGSKTFSNTISGSINGNAATATSVSGGTASVTTLTTSSTVTHNAGTANGVPYLNGSKVLTSGSALTFDGSSLIAQGVAAYQANFQQTNANSYGEIRVTGSSRGGQLEFMNGTTRLSGLYGDTANNLFFVNGTGDTVRATLDSSGNLGLGVTPSAFTFPAVESSVGIWAGRSETNNVSNAYFNSGWKYISSSVAATRYRQNAGLHHWDTAPSGTAGNAITFTQAMTLDANGNLGLGTTSPSSYLGLAAQRVLAVGTTSGNNGVNVVSGTTSVGAYSFSDSGGNDRGAVVYSHTADQMSFRTNGAVQATIDSSGNLLVGTTTATGIGGVTIAPNYALFNNASTSLTVAYFQYNSSTVGSISRTTTATTYATSSDYRLKEVTGSLTGYKERLMSLQPKQGTWIVDGSEFRGFLAHEFAAPYSASVTGEKDAVDEDGKPVMQAMQASSSEVMADLVAYIQNLEQRLAALEAA